MVNAEEYWTIFTKGELSAACSLLQLDPKKEYPRLLKYLNSSSQALNIPESLRTGTAVWLA